MPTVSSTPVLVEVTRGDTVECRHRGVAAIVDANGRLMASWGDVERPVFPRSAVKLLQAIPLIESGAADAFDVSDEELTLACASHSGEPAHVDRVAAWLSRAGLAVGDLECGTHVPKSASAAAALIRQGESPSALHNNCSGKHTGMLFLARRLDAESGGYVAADHPVQLAWRDVLADMTDLDLDKAPSATDGCSIPTIALSIAGLARAASRFAAPDRLPEERAEACRRLSRAVAAAPLLIDGTDRFCTRVIEGSGGRVIVKVGAAGVFFAAVPESGIGMGLKIDDGSEDAAECAIATLLATHGGLDDSLGDLLRELAVRPVVTRRGVAVGAIRPAADWIDS